MTIQKNNNGTEEAANSSNVTDLKAQPSEDHAEQKVILLPRKRSDPKLFWVGFLAKYFDIWAPTSSVRLKEDGSPYTFDFYCESRSQLFKVFTVADEAVIRSYLDLPYAEHILFILDKDTDSFELDCCYCGNCYACNRVDELAYEMGAYICHRKGSEINHVLGEDEDGDRGNMEPYPY